MRTLNQVKERNAVLHALDAITIGILGDEWSVVAHIAIKTMLLDIIDGETSNEQ